MLPFWWGDPLWCIDLEMQIVFLRATGDAEQSHLLGGIAGDQCFNVQLHWRAKTFPMTPTDRAQSKSGFQGLCYY